MIWLVGHGGMLGRALEAALAARGLAYVGTGRSVDVGDEAGILAVAEDLDPSWILNAAAFTDVDGAEAHPEDAHRANALGPLHLARAAEATGARLLHVSTDMVFDGEAADAYAEDAPVAPTCVYGRTKAEGEVLLRRTTERHVIVRTSWVHGPSGRNFVGTILDRLATEAEVRVVDDQRGSPTYVADLAGALLAFALAEDAPYGTYHYANAGVVSRYALAEAVRKEALARGLLKTAAPVLPVPTTAFPTPARRLKNSALRTDKIQGTLGIRIPSWEDGLRRHLEHLRERTRSA